MKNLLYILVALLAVSCSIKDRPIGEKVFLTIPDNKDDEMLICHKTSDCDSIKKSVLPIDTINIKNLSIPISFCSYCFSDKDITLLRIPTILNERLLENNERAVQEELAALFPIEDYIATDSDTTVVVEVVEDGY